MGHSIQSVGDRHAILNDHDIRTLVAYLGILRDQLDTIPAALSETIGTWVSAIDTWGNGLIDLNLDNLARDPAQALALSELLRHLEVDLAGKGDCIPNEELDTLLQVPRRNYPSGYPTQHLIKAARELRELLPQSFPD